MIVDPKDLADQWKYSQPEAAREYQKQGENLEEVAARRIEAADRERVAYLDSVKKELEAQYSDPDKVEMEMKRARLDAWEMMNEDLKYL